MHTHIHVHTRTHEHACTRAALHLQEKMTKVSPEQAKVRLSYGPCAPS